MKASMIKWFEKMMLGALAAMKSFADADSDGDVDMDDVEILYERTVEVLMQASETVANWASLSVGQRIDAVVAVLKAEFPKVKTTVWVILESLAYFILFLKGKAK